MPARARLTAAGFGVDYFALVDGPSLTPIAAVRAGGRLIAAAKLGAVRLLDNIPAWLTEKADTAAKT